jgi:hypothetical protein
MPDDARVDGEDPVPRPPPPYWLQWVWYLALVVMSIVIAVLFAVLSLLGVPWRILRWLTDELRRRRA